MTFWKLVEPETLVKDLDDEDILAALGVEINAKDENDITNLQNVKTRAEIKAAEKVGQHTRVRILKYSSHYL